MRIKYESILLCHEDLRRRRECMILNTSLCLGGLRNIDVATFWFKYFENRLFLLVLILSTYQFELYQFEVARLSCTISNINVPVTKITKSKVKHFRSTRCSTFLMLSIPYMKSTKLPNSFLPGF